MEEVLTLTEASQYLKVNKVTIYRLVHQNKIPAFKVGKIWRFRRDDIEAWVEANSNQALKGKAAEAVDNLPFLDINKADFLKERRVFPRVSVLFPVDVSTDNAGETINLSETGLCLTLEKPVASSKAFSIQLNLPLLAPLQSQVEIIWTRHYFKDGKHVCGVRFSKLNKETASLLREAILKSKNLDRNFMYSTSEFRSKISNLKKRFDNFDANNEDQNRQNSFIERNKENIFSTLDEHFNKTWGVLKSIDEKRINLHNEYYKKMLWGLLRDFSEINRHICQKPLGYPGDYIIMNYFYDFYNKYLGNSSYERLLNSYTCNIPIARSVVKRKNFFKKAIAETLNEKMEANVLNVGSGPARELIELIREGKITKRLNFDCLDFEQKALDFIGKELEGIKPEKKNYLTSRLINRNLMDLIHGKDTGQSVKKYDFIYSAGLFDYLPDRVAKRLLTYLCNLLASNSRLIICNADKENVSLRPYYETLGEWYLKYRTKQEMLNLVVDIRDVKKVEFTNQDEQNLFLFLSVKSGVK